MNPAAFHLRADFDGMPRLAEWVAEQAPVFAMNERQLYAIQLCLEEVVANLVMHAKPAGGAGVAITVRIEGSPLRVTVEDDAEPFDLTEAAPARAAASLEEAMPGGLGLGLVQGFSSSRAYAREHGVNRLVLRFDQDQVS